MKNSLVKRMYVILIITVLLSSAGIYAIVYFTSQSMVREDVRTRANGVKDYILASLDGNDFIDIGENTEAGINASLNIQRILNNLRGVGGLRRLYIAKIDENNEIITTLSASGGADAGYQPSGRLEADLRQSIYEGMAIFAETFYQTDDGSVFTIFWPVMNQYNELLGVVSMEFDVSFLENLNGRSLTYGLFLAGGLLLILSVTSYLSLNRASEPYFKKLAYTDFLTGYENRMAFEHRLREVGNLAEKGEKVTLIICDVNNLKKINDTQGHKVGDVYIKSTADILHSNLRDSGSLYRIGGDEFAMIIVGKDEEYIKEMMKALRNENRQTVKGQSFSCACGAAMFTPGIDDTLRDVFKRADDAMYIEKKRQKGNTCNPR
jgi:diguanylate cyclase (GGDEF)-like protein